MRALLITLLLASSAWADVVPPAYVREASRAGIPAGSLYAIALTESGYTRCKKGTPWPWSINDNGERSQTGKSLCFKSRAAMFGYAWGQVRRGNRRFDLGPMQMNWHYNRDKFARYGADEYARLWAATHPLINIRVASAFIKTLIQRHGLDKMPGVYHAGAGKGREARKQRYTAVYRRHKARLSGLAQQ